MKTVKEFIKPTWKKVILLILVGVILSYSSLACHSYRDTALNSSLDSDSNLKVIILPSLVMECGFPFPYLKTITSPLCPQCHLWNFDITNNLYFIINLLCWYLIACFIIFALAKLKKISFLNTKIKIAAWLLLISTAISLYKFNTYFIHFIFLIIPCIYLIFIVYFLKERRRWLWHAGVIIIGFTTFFYSLFFLLHLFLFPAPMQFFFAVLCLKLIFVLYALFSEKNYFFELNNQIK